MMLRERWASNTFELDIRLKFIGNFKFVMYKLKVKIDNEKKEQRKQMNSAHKLTDSNLLENHMK